MSKNLYEASYQWQTRPDDQRFATLNDLAAATKRHADQSRSKEVAIADLRAQAHDGDLFLVGPANNPAKLSHYSFGQVARLSGAPAEYLRGLPATLAAQNINHGLKRAAEKKEGDKLNLLLTGTTDTDTVARAVTTDSYDRVWNYQIADMLLARAAQAGWRVPPARPAREGQAGTRPATAADILPNQENFGLAVKVGDPIAPAGLYASDHDMFVFLVNQQQTVSDGQKQLNRGIFIQNSEVGDCSIRFKLFTYDNVCGNHIVWGAGEIEQLTIRHVKGQKRIVGNTFKTALAKWTEITTQRFDVAELEATIARARTVVLGADKEEAIGAAQEFARRFKLDTLTFKTLEAGYDLCEQTPRYGSPRTVWGLLNGLTEMSQSGYTDQRTELDIQASQLLKLAV